MDEEELLGEYDEAECEEREARRAAERAAESEARLAQERRWQADHPEEWAAWVRVQSTLWPVFGVEYAFPDFLKEVGPDRFSVRRVERKDELQPFRAGN